VILIRRNTVEPRISIITLGVSDLERSYEFYHEGLGFPTTRKPDQGVIFFQTGGTCLALYPHGLLAEDISPGFPKDRSRFSGITLSHNTRKKEGVDQVLKRAEQAGGVIESAAKIRDWGGYSGYFSDPDGYLWEVAWSDNWKFHEDGSLVIT
jgi:catechol 2,3-dioxygenase-like lactoylglutathione lyase family enzyme